MQLERVVNQRFDQNAFENITREYPYIGYLDRSHDLNISRGITQRENTFESVCQKMWELAETGFDSNVFRNLNSLTEQLAQVLPAPTVKRRLKKSNEAFASKKLSFPHVEEYSLTEDNPNRTISALLVEAMGARMEELSRVEGIGRTFTLAFQEVLYTHFSNSSMAADVSDWMRSQKDEFSPEIQQELDIEEYPENRELSELSRYLNKRFDNGDSAFRLRNIIRQFPLPIITDFNDVLVNRGEPLQLNPDAEQYLAELREIGNVFIVTTAGNRNRQAIKDFLVQNGVWSDDLILMTKENWQSVVLEDEGQEKPDALTVIEEYKRLPGNESFSEKDFESNYVGKHLAPLFCKPFKIPIADDGDILLKKTGMLPYQVWPWVPEIHAYRPIERAIPLLSFPELVRSHYAAVTAEKSEQRPIEVVSSLPPLVFLVKTEQEFHTFADLVRKQFELRSPIRAIGNELRGELEQTVINKIRRGQPVCIQSVPRMGSSSFLHRVENEFFGKRIFMDAQQYTHDKKEGVEHVKREFGINEIAKFLVYKNGGKGSHALQYRAIQESEKDPFTYLNDSLESDEHIVIIIDEAMVFRDMPEAIRFFANIASHSNLIPLINLYNYAQDEEFIKQEFVNYSAHNVGTLSFEQIERYLRRKLEHIGISFSQDALEEMMSFSGGRPMEINILVAKLFREIADAKPFNSKDIKPIYNKVDIKRISDRPFKELERDFIEMIHAYRAAYEFALGDVEKNILRDLLTKKTVSKTRVPSNSAQRLLDVGMIREKEDSYILNGTLLEKTFREKESQK